MWIGPQIWIVLAHAWTLEKYDGTTSENLVIFYFAQYRQQQQQHACNNGSIATLSTYSKLRSLFILWDDVCARNDEYSIDDTEDLLLSWAFTVESVGRMLHKLRRQQKSCHVYAPWTLMVVQALKHYQSFWKWRHCKSCLSMNPLPCKGSARKRSGRNGTRFRMSPTFCLIADTERWCLDSNSHDRVRQLSGNLIFSFLPKKFVFSIIIQIKHLH